VAATADRVSTRERILYSAAELFRRQGYAATGLKQVVAAANAPFGSLYHHFPGGKEQLGDEVLRAGGAFYLVAPRAVRLTPARLLLRLF
jgi:AcrR family transcriptional regulator